MGESEDFVSYVHRLILYVSKNDNTLVIKEKNQVRSRAHQLEGRRIVQSLED